MKLPSSAIASQLAIEQGYRPLTIGYKLPDDRKYLDNVQRDLDAGNIDFCLVSEQGSTQIEIWRKNMSFIDGNDYKKMGVK